MLVRFYTAGQYKKLIGAGPHFILWPLQAVTGRLSLRVQQLDVLCETKTKVCSHSATDLSITLKCSRSSFYIKTSNLQRQRTMSSFTWVWQYSTKS